MQTVRGFIYFEGKSFDYIKSNFKNFKFDGSKFYFFKSLFRYDKEISEAGVFIDGDVGDKYSSQDIVKFFRKHVGLEEKSRGCDISIESEDTLKLIKNGSLNGYYTGLRIKTPYELNQIYGLAARIGKISNASNIFVRTVESEDDKPLICIDLITKNEFANYKKQVEQLIKKESLTLGKYTIIKLS
jgi:hypothetical protein